jgi:hypothetical protein
MAEKKKLKNKSKEDPYTSRNEFKKGFYEQADKPPITDDTMYGMGRKSTPPTYEIPEDIMSYAKGGIAKGCGKVMKDRKKVTKMY